MNTETRPPRRIRPVIVGVLIGFGIGFAVGAGTNAATALRSAWHRVWGISVHTPAKKTGAEIAQLGNAVGAFKAKFQAEYLPAARPGSPTGDGFRLCSSYTDPATGTWLDWPEVPYLLQLFPGMNRDDNGLRFDGNPVPPTSPHVLDSNQTLLFFLTGSVYTNYQGFLAHKPFPFARAVAGERQIGPFLDVSANELGASRNPLTPPTVPWLLDRWGTPYAYFAYDKSIDGYPALNWNGVTAYRQGGRPLNARGVQIISAGRNKVFGPGGEWAPGQGAWAPDGAGGDDIGNFNAGLLAERHNP